MPALKCYMLFLTAILAYAHGFTDSKLLMSMLSGHFSNDQDLIDLAGNGIRTKQSSLNVFYRALIIPALQRDPVIYFEKYVDGVLILQQILQFTETTDIVRIRQHNFKHPENFIPGTFDFSKLESLTKDDLTSSPECDVYIRRVDDTVFQLNWPDCTRPNGCDYYITITCKSATFVAPKNTFVEEASKIPYAVPKVESYPIPDSVLPGYKDYMSLCKS